MTDNSEKTIYVISRPINGISLNGNEYVLNDDGNVLEFENIIKALQFLVDNEFEHNLDNIFDDIDSGSINIEKKEKD